MTSPDFRVALRADASPLSGLGHLKRCISLALALREVGADVRIVTRPLGVQTRTMTREAGIENLMLPAPAGAFASADAVPHAHWAGVGWAQDAAETCQALAPWAPHCVVVDHYAFDARWHRQVAGALGARIAAIDDLADRPLDVHCLIDHNLSPDHREKYRDRIGPQTLVLGGPRFALLGPAYAAMQPLHIEDAVRSIGIFMGGVDAADLTRLALRACREHAGFAGPVEIVATAANPHLAALTECAAQWPGTTVVCDLPDLAGFFSRHGLQIGAGGGAAWERCCAGAPTLALMGAANQQAVLPALAELGAVATFDPGRPMSAETLGRAVAALLADPARRRRLAGCARSLVDGRGAHRAALALAAPSLSLREAVASDAQRTFAWRNDPATRRFSRDAGALTPGGHRDWWQKTLLDPRRKLFIAHLGRHDVGVLRLDVTGEEAEISIYLDPALTGLALGQTVLRAGQRWAQQTGTPSLKRLVAHILPGNDASEKVFAKVGFTPHGERWVWNVQRMIHPSSIGETHVQNR